MSERQPPTLGNPQHQAPQAQPPYDDEIDLLELWRALMHGKWIIIAFTAVFSVASVFYALSLPNMYKSTAALAPAESASDGGLGRLAGLASIAGVNLGGGGNKTEEALQILQSWAFIEEFIQEQNIAPQVFAAKTWNSQSRELVYDPEVYDSKAKVWLREPPKGKTKPEPSSWELYEVFSQMLSAGKDDKTGFYSVSIESHSPENSKAWVDAILEKINKDIKARDRKESEANIEFLKVQAANTDLAGLQSVFYSLIEDQTKSLMLASGSDDYVFRVISHPRVPEKKTAPSRSVICIVSALLGFMIGAFVALIRYKVSKRSLSNVD